MKKQILILISLMLITSCGQKSFDTEEEMWEYLKNEENGFYHKKSVNGINFSIIQRPTDLLVKQELGDEKNKKKIKELRKKYEKYLYLNLSMGKNNKELLSAVPRNRNEFGAMVNQLAFGMGEKVHLYTKQKDTIELTDFVYPRLYGMTTATTIMFVYPREKKLLETEYLNFTIEDLDLYTGEVKFKLPVKNIINEPKLTFN